MGQKVASKYFEAARQQWKKGVLFVSNNELSMVISVSRLISIMIDHRIYYGDFDFKSIFNMVKYYISQMISVFQSFPKWSNIELSMQISMELII